MVRSSSTAADSRFRASKRFALGFTMPRNAWRTDDELRAEMLRRRTVAASECWLWTGASAAGYGVVSFRGKQITVPRLSLLLFHGIPVPVGMAARHSCGNARCFNPDHLSVGKKGDNPLPTDKESLIRALEEKRTIEANGCWMWTARKAGNYGSLRRGGKNLYVHRLSYELHRGPIPAGMDVCHTCDTPLCFNPDHLFAGTRSDNMADMVAKGRQRQPRSAAH